MDIRKSSAEAAIRLLRSLFPGDDGACEAVDYLAEKVEGMDWEERVSPDFGELPPPLEIDAQGYALFSDGACRGNPGPGAWGILGQNAKGEALFSSGGVELSTTNNRMELEGAIQALEHLRDHLGGPCDQRISLFSDSKYVVEGITKWVAGWKSRGWRKADKTIPQNLELWRRLDEQVRSVGRVEFHWVKGHAGHPQNEYVDRLANELLDRAGF